MPVLATTLGYTWIHLGTYRRTHAHTTTQVHATHTEKTKFFDNDIEKTGAKIMMPSEMGYLVLNNNFLV